MTTTLASVTVLKRFVMQSHVANPNDIIIFAGKGHEDFQIIGKTKYPHSDAEIALLEAEKKFGSKEVRK